MWIGRVDGHDAECGRRARLMLGCGESRSNSSPKKQLLLSMPVGAAQLGLLLYGCNLAKQLP